MQTQEYRKVYVNMQVIMTDEGMVKPCRFLWEDGHKYTIDRVLHMCPAASTKVGGRGMRYTVMIEGRERFVFREEDRWFMEVPITK